MAKQKQPSIYLSDAWYEAAEDAMVDQLEDAGHEIAGNIPSKYDSGVLMRRDRNGRPVVLVSLQHPNGVAIQAKNATLTKAAAAAGVDVHRYPRR